MKSFALEAAAVIAIAPGLARTQTTEKVVPSFEVASVKPSKPRDPGKANQSRGLTAGRYEMLGYSLGQFVQFAYQVLPDRVQCPGWLYSERFDIVATLPPDTTRSQAMLMLQTLLAERFKLKAHREERQTEVYALEVGKNGPKMAPTEWDDGPGRSITPGPNITAKKSSIGALAYLLTAWMDHPVIDKTGLTGLYNFTLRWRPDGPAGSASGGSEVFGAVEEQLGLKLVARKLPIEFVVVDHAEKVPIEN